MATAIAEIHIANGVKEPQVALGAVVTPVSEKELDRRRYEANAVVDPGLTMPLSRELIEPIKAQLVARIYHTRDSLASEPTSVLTYSLWNIEPGDSVVILHDKLHLLNGRLDNVRRSPPLDPMSNLARYVYLSRVLTHQRHNFRQKIEGAWLLQTYFDVSGFGKEARRQSTSRFWRWLDLELILYFFYFLALARDKESRRNAQILIALCDLERITGTAFNLDPLG